MVAIVEHSDMPLVVRDAIVPPSGQAARALAEAYLRSISADWRGEPGWQAFERSLDRCWSLLLPPVPRAVPDAVSPHGAGGRGVHWYQTENEVVGYVPGSNRGYRVPIRSRVVPLVKAFGDQPAG
jgi:hypothetical protein